MPLIEDPHPDEQLRTAAQQLAAMLSAETIIAPDYVLRALRDLPRALLNIAGDVRLMRDESGPQPIGNVLGEFLMRRRGR